MKILVTGAPACDRDPEAAKTTNFEAVRMLLELQNKEQVIACSPASSWESTSSPGQGRNRLNFPMSTSYHRKTGWCQFNFTTLNTTG